MMAPARSCGLPRLPSVGIMLDPSSSCMEISHDGSCKIFRGDLVCGSCLRSFMITHGD